jgi:hypothetical protein
LWKTGFTQEFYENLEPYPWASRLYALGKAAYDKVFFLTATPFTDADKVAAGKYRWLAKFTGDKRIALNTVLAPSKEKCLLASPDRVLVDDRAVCIEPWRMSGGLGVQWPESLDVGHEVTEQEINAAMALVERMGSRVIT